MPNDILQGSKIHSLSYYLPCCRTISLNCQTTPALQCVRRLQALVHGGATRFSSRVHMMLFFHENITNFQQTSSFHSCLCYLRVRSGQKGSVRFVVTMLQDTSCAAITKRQHDLNHHKNQSMSNLGRAKRPLSPVRQSLHVYI